VKAAAEDTAREYLRQIRRRLRFDDALSTSAERMDRGVSLS
jgi:hypothetical protein